MKILFALVAIIAVVMIGISAFVRTSSTDVAAFSAAPAADGPGDVESAGSFQAARRITTTPEGVLQALDSVARNSPRTTLFAGSVEEGTMTWQSRSRIFGFPDYTTATVDTTGDAPLLVIYGRLKYGQADMGVNRARVQNWLAQLGPLIAPAS